MTRSLPPPTERRKAFLFLLAAVFVLLSLVALLSPLLKRMLSPTPEVGQVAQQDILAREALTYTSEVLTEQRRQDVERAIPNVFTAPDTSVARQQLERLRATIAYINSVRADGYATSKQKLDDLAALDEIHINQETAFMILALSDSRWLAVQQEAITVLEQLMRRTIRSDNVEDIRRNVQTMVSLSLPEGQAAIVAELAAAFVTPNSFYSEALTVAARKEAREAVKPITRTYALGQTVVQRGQVLSAADVEALVKMGLAQPQRRWQDPAGAAALVVLTMVFFGLYLGREPSLAREPRAMVVMLILFQGFLLSARLVIPDHTVLPYAFPLAGYGLLVAALFGSHLAMVSSLPLAVMAAFGLPNALDLTLYYVMGTLVGILGLGNARRMVSFVWAAMAVGISSTAIIMAYRLPLPTSDLIGITTLTGAAFFSGLASAGVSVLLQFFMAQFLGLTTPMQLMELTRPDHPLLQRLLHDSPGTYQHSLQVANLAEQAAEQIGADTLLTRVGALYHDAGKALNPVFFIENQMPGFLNPHDDLDPATSAATIIRHVTDGLLLAKEHRLPRRIMDFIGEHHGTMLTRYQYVNAVKASGCDESRVNKEHFRYPGPRPSSRETAILMLADGCEARMRAEHPKNEDELRVMIKSVIDDRVSAGELDHTNITLRELDVILNSFVTTLRGIYHPRIQYPQLDAETKTELPAPAATVYKELPQ